MNAYPPEDLWESIIHPQDRDRVLGTLSAVIKEGLASKWEDEYRLKMSNGEYAYVHDREYIIYSADQRPYPDDQGRIQDITVRKRSDGRSFLASEEKYRQYLL